MRSVRSLAAVAGAKACRTVGHTDWRLPNAKELQSIVDYSRAPVARDQSKRGPAIDPVFKTTSTKGWCWSSTTHLDGPRLGDRAVYITFGRAMGLMTDPRTGRRQWLDVHGAGAQRSDPKSGDPKDYATGMGPQGDEIRIYNYARAVRNIDASAVKIVQPSTARLKHIFAPPGGHGRPPASASAAQARGWRATEVRQTDRGGR